MPSAEYDLRYLQAGVPLLENYLLSTEIYWPIGVSSPAGEPPYPRLTLGGLLLAQARLHARQDLSSVQRAELARLDEQINETRSHWRVAWGQKAAHELQARLKLWRDFLEEVRDNSEANIDRYTYEVQRRVMLHLLEPEAEAVPKGQFELLRAMDKMLSGVFVSGDFIWDHAYQPGFPADTFWYLYGKPAILS